MLLNGIFKHFPTRVQYNQTKDLLFIKGVQKNSIVG